MNYVPNAGQTYMPFQNNIKVDILPFKPLERPNPLLPPLEVLPEFLQRGIVLNNSCQHFLPGVTPEMLDWFWANMEKCYYLWAPGSHKRFNWVHSPGEVGFVASSHMISETIGPGLPVFGGNGIEIKRLDLGWFPFTTALKHVIVEGVFTEKNEFVDSTIHMWEAAPGGSVHLTASVANTRLSEPPAFAKEMMSNPVVMKAAAKLPPNYHSEYEASRWPVFLPTLYELWKGHPDPSQNVQCDLRVRKTGKGKWGYFAANGPVYIS